MSEKPFVTASLSDYAPDVIRRCEEAGATEDGKYRVKIEDIDKEPFLYSPTLLISCLTTKKDLT